LPFPILTCNGFFDNDKFGKNLIFNFPCASLIGLAKMRLDASNCCGVKRHVFLDLIIIDASCGVFNPFFPFCEVFDYIDTYILCFLVRVALFSFIFDSITYS